jgi:hypothetical protein
VARLSTNLVNRNLPKVGLEPVINFNFVPVAQVLLNIIILIIFSNARKKDLSRKVVSYV